MPSRPLLVGVALALLHLLQAGCASHSDHTRAIRSALDANQPAAALAIVNDELDVESGDELPEDVEQDTVLFVLDRSTIQQQLGNLSASSRDLEFSDKQIELLDFSQSALDDIGQYIFSDDTGPYRAPAYEKVMINTLNMVNYLARGDLSNARVEARRFSIMNEFVTGGSEQGRSMAAPGAYLAGFVFERSGNIDEALRYYDEALELSTHPSLAQPITRLLARSGYTTPRLQAAAQAPQPGNTEDATETSSGEILVVVSYGRVPSKIAKRVPIGLALTMASGSISPYDQSRANRIAAQGAVTWVNYPELGPSTGAWSTAAASIDQTALRLDPAFQVEEETRRAWDSVKGAVIASAITRLVARLATGAVAREATRSKKAGLDLLSLLLSFGTQAAMAAADTPDTRSWATLPARMTFARVRVAPGEHTVRITASGVTQERRVTLRPGGWAVVNMTVLK